MLLVGSKVRPVYMLSRVQLFATPSTVACQVPLSRGFSGQEYWSGCHFLFQGIFQTQGSNLCFFMSPELAGGLFTTSTTWEAPPESGRARLRGAPGGLGLRIVTLIVPSAGT